MRCVDLDGHRLADQIDSQHEPGVGTLPDEAPDHATQQ